MKSIVLVAHNIRSAHNIGAIMRSADCFGVNEIIFSGYSPYPQVENDTRLPHIVTKLTEQIHKTALGAELTVPYTYSAQIPIDNLIDQGFNIVALEQSKRSIPLSSFAPSEKTAIIIGEERYGITDEILDKCQTILEIPQHGSKESLNVSVATGICLYQLSQKAYT